MKLNSHSDVVRFVIAAMLMIFGAFTVNGQSTNASSPTPLDPSYSGKGPSQETNYYFAATRGPGEVSVTVTLTAKQYSTFARLEATGASGNMLATLNMDASTSTGKGQQIRTFTLSTKQQVRFKLTLDQNLESYTISLNGGGAIGPVGRPAGAGQSARPTPSTRPGGTPGRVAGGTEPLRRNSISYECPTTLVSTIQMPTGWSAPFGPDLKLQFVEAAITKGQISCRYGETMDQTLIRSVPQGYACEIYNSGSSRPRMIQCKAVSSPIKPSE